MAFTLTPIAAKDSAGTAIGGGLMAADVAGGGVGPFFLFHGLVDGVAGVNRASITAGNALKVDGSAVTQPVSNAGTFVVQATLAAETTKVLGVARLADGAGNLLTSTAGKIDVNIGSGVNANLSDGSAQTSVAHVGAPTVNLDPYSQYETVAAGSTDQIMGATGGQYDYLAGVLIIPGTAAAGAVSIKDGNGSAISIFAGGGTTALPSLVPFIVPLGLHCLAGTTPGWKITTGTNVTAVGIGKFT